MTDEEKQLMNLLKQYKAPDMEQSRVEQMERRLYQELSGTFLTPEKRMLGGIWSQAGYISPVTWMFQLLILLAGAALVSMQTEEALWLGMTVLVPLIGLVGVPELAKSFHCGMWELEESCFYNLREIVMMKMVIFGVVDGVLLLAMLWMAGRGGMGFTESVAAILIPFNCSNAIYLELFRFFKRRCTGYVLAAAAFLTIMVFLSFRQVMPLMPAAVSGLAVEMAAVLAGGISLLALLGSGRHLLKHMKKEEQTLWSFEQIV